MNDLEKAIEKLEFIIKVDDYNKKHYEILSLLKAHLEEDKSKIIPVSIRANLSLKNENEALKEKIAALGSHWD